MSDSEHSCLVTLVFYLSSLRLWPRQLVTREWCPTLDTSSLSFFKPPFPHNLIIIWSPSNILFKYVSVRWIMSMTSNLALRVRQETTHKFWTKPWVGGWVDGRPLDDLCQESSAKFKLFDSFLAPLCSYLNFLSPVSPHSGLKLLIGWEKLK